MKKTYTKKQITEAIAYWQKQLRAKQYIYESKIDIESLKTRLINAAQDKVTKQMPKDIEAICRDIVENFVHNHAEQMLKKFAENYNDVVKGRQTKEFVYEQYFSKHEYPDATSLYAMCNGNLYQLKNSVEIVSATVNVADYDCKDVSVTFKYSGKTYNGIDVWYSGKKANDDKDEFQHCDKNEFDRIINWIDDSDDVFAELPVTVLDCIKGKYISKSNLLDILDYTLVDNDNNDAKYIKII